jgi:uncharacterized membrane protein YkvI
LTNLNKLNFGCEVTDWAQGKIKNQTWYFLIVKIGLVFKFFKFENWNKQYEKKLITSQHWYMDMLGKP